MNFWNICRFDTAFKAVTFFRSLCIIMGVNFYLFGCLGKNSVVPLDSRSSSLQDSSLEQSVSDEEFIVDYEDIYLDDSKVYQHKKYWQNYRAFTSRLQKHHWSSSKIDKDDLLSSVLGDKKWTLVTPALWENSSHSFVSTATSNESLQLLSNFGSMFIAPSHGGDNLPNGKASLGKFFLDLGEQDVYIDVLLAPKPGYITEFEGKKTVSGPWSDSPLKKKWGSSGIFDFFSTSTFPTDLNNYALYLVLAFPLHKAKPLEKLSGVDVDNINKFQDGIKKYILHGETLKFPFGTSLDSFFSKRIARFSIKNSQGSYTSRSVFSLGMQLLLTQYKAISMDVFSQMSQQIFDGHTAPQAVSNTETISSSDPHPNSQKNLIVPPGYFTQSVVYKNEHNQPYSTYNSVVMVPFLIEKILENEETGKKGLLLKGNPLAIRVLSMQPKINNLSKTSYQQSKQESDTQISSSLSLPTEIDTLLAADKENATTATKLRQELAKLGQSAQNIAEEQNVMQNIFDVLESSDSSKNPVQSIASREIPQFILSDDVSKTFLDFSWNSIKEKFEKPEFRKNLLRAQKSRAPNNNTNLNKEKNKKISITSYQSIENHNIGALLQYAGFDLIFWPEDDLDVIRSKLHTDFQK